MDGKLIVGWKKPFDIASSVGLTKKNPQSKSEDSSLESKWLPNPEDVRTIFMNHAGHIHIPFLSPV